MTTEGSGEQKFIQIIVNKPRSKWALDNGS